ncbi:MAG: SUMF1/EgtB/PvdO family nonheme iron enzyme [Verrucomicrobiaceae bacterium]|nr:SUMF1/EgtB/PvdO family nonheme iron enzyme [Verrucomicrobiaceae bacterium]
MTSTPFDILSLAVQMPARWALGEPRKVRLRLRNGSGIDLKGAQVRTGWSGEELLEEHWKRLGNLPRGVEREESVSVLPPNGREDQFHLSLRVEMGPYLQIELWSAKVDVQAKPKPGAEGSVQVIFENAGIQGDKLGANMLAAEGHAIIGHQMHYHGKNATADFERWLEEDEHARQMRALPLYIAHETCLPWTNPSGLELLGIPRGEFRMGAGVDDREAEPEEKIRRDVTLTRSFWMSRHPVTNAQYAAVTQTPTPVTLKGHKADNMPVANVSWGQAMDFCARLTEQERAAGMLPPGYAYRLPTEAEWEHACRAGCAAPRHGPLEKIGSVLANGGRMMSVGRFESNAWGLHDMLGLVFEWCLDAYAPYRPMETTDPVRWDADAGAQLHRVIRGGCYQGPDTFARASARFGRDPQSKSHRVGFRVVLARE